MTAGRKTCSSCNGTGDPRTRYDYVRGRNVTEYCERCDGDGVVPCFGPQTPIKAIDNSRRDV